MGSKQQNEYGVFRRKGGKDIWCGQKFPTAPPEGYEIKSGTAEHIFQLNLNSLSPYRELYDPKTQTLLPSMCFMEFKKSKNGIMLQPISYEDLLKVSNHSIAPLVLGNMKKIRKTAIEIIELCHSYFIKYGLKQNRIGNAYWTPNFVNIRMGSSNGQLNSWEVLNSIATVYLNYDRKNIWDQSKQPDGYDKALWNEICDACKYVENKIEKHSFVDMADMEKVGDNGQDYGVRVFIEELFNSNPNDKKVNEEND